MARDFAVVLLWVAAFFRLSRSVARPHSRSLHAVTAGLFAIAVAGTVGLPEVATAVDGGMHWPQVSAAIQSAAIVFTAVGIQVMLMYLDRGEQLAPRAARSRWLAAAGVCVLVFAVFFVGGRPAPTPGIDYGEQASDNIWFSASRLIADLYALPVLIQVVRMCRRQVTRSTLGQGIAALGFGAGFLAVHVTLRLVYLGGEAFGLAPPTSIYSVGTLFASLGITFIALGTLLSPLAAWLRGVFDVWLLTPLWRAVVDEQPQVVEHQPAVRGATRVSEFRVVQIQDAMYLMAIRRGDAGDASVPRDARQTARRITEWVADKSDRGVSPEMLGTPAGLSERRWASLLAGAYRRAHTSRPKESLDGSGA